MKASDVISKAFSRRQNFQNWWRFYLNKFKIEKHLEEYYSARTGETFHIREGTADRVVLDEVYCDRIYTREFGIQEDYTVVDIGAQVGVFTVFAALRGAEVHAYEASTENFSWLRHNVELNGLENVELSNRAVTDGEKEAVRLSLTRNTGGHSLHSDTGRFQEIETVSFEEVVDRAGEIDFLKLDCEGAEHGILRSSPSSLEKVERLVMEVHGRDREMVDFLEDEGFEVFYDEEGFIHATG